MHNSYAGVIIDTDLTQDEDDQIEALHKKAKDAHKVTMNKLTKVLDDNQPSTQVQLAGSNSGSTKKSIKIEELLKPREPLVESMCLEEAQHWIKRYEAFLEHNNVS